MRGGGGGGGLEGIKFLQLQVLNATFFGTDLNSSSDMAKVDFIHCMHMR